MSGSHVSQIILIVNGLPIVHLRSYDYRVRTNRELVVGQTPSGTPAGFSDGTAEYSLDLEVYIPKTGDLDWDSISGAVIASMPRGGGAHAPLFQGVFVTEVGASFKEKGSAIRRISAMALKKVGLD